MSGDVVTQDLISGAEFNQFKEYFANEIRRIEQRYEGKIQHIEEVHKADIDEIWQELNEKTREIRVLNDQYEAAMNEIINLKGHVSKIGSISKAPSFAKIKFEEGNANTDRQSENRANKAKFTAVKNQDNRITIEEETEKKPEGFIRHQTTKKGTCTSFCTLYSLLLNIELKYRYIGNIDGTIFCV